MDRESLKKSILEILPEADFKENKQFIELIVPTDKLLPFCELIKNNEDLSFDYLFCLTAIDWKDHFMVVYHLTSTKFNHTLVMKIRTENYQNPQVDSVAGIWKTAEFHEREVFDLFGIKFNNHPDLRRLFMEDDYGFPLRKDFTDEINMIVR